MATGMLLIAMTCKAGPPPITYTNTWSNYGTVANDTCGPGICGAVEAINSFVYLSNTFPDIYGGTNIAIGNNGGSASAVEDAADDFALGGWTLNGIHYLGYYERTALSLAQTGSLHSITNFIATKLDWLNSFAPGTTSLVYRYRASGGLPDWAFLNAAMAAHDDVELFVFSSDNIGHAIDLTDIATIDPSKGCDVVLNCDISYQDPNDPTHEHYAFITQSANGLTFFDQGTFNAQVTIGAAFAESVPEPGPILLLTAPLCILAATFSRRRHGSIASHSPEAAGLRPAAS